jgi:hypothetical protein
VPLMTHCKNGRALQTPRNEGVMSSMTWLTRLSAKAHFSARHWLGLESGVWESAGDDRVALDCPNDRSVDGVLVWPSSRTMCASKKSAMDRGASC